MRRSPPGRGGRLLLLLLGCSLLTVTTPGQTIPPQAAQDASPNALYRAASDAYERGDLKTAHARFARLVELAPQVAVGHAAFGEVLLAEGQAAAALVQLEMAQKLDPKAAGTYIAIANTWLALGSPAKAASAFGQGVSAGAVLDAEESRSYATALAADGQTQQAIEVLQAALKPSPDGQPGLSAKEMAVLEDAWGTLLALRGDYEQSWQHFHAAIAADAGLSSAHAHLGSALLAAHQPDAAAEELRQAVALAPDQAGYATELGRALTVLGQDAEAVAVLRRALQLTEHPAGQGAGEPTGLGRQQARYALALALQAGGAPQEALPLFAEYTAAQPADSQALTNYALALVQTGDAKRAVVLYQQALARGPDNATLREDYGVAYLQQSDLDHAIEQFRAGLALEPENPHLHYDLGLAYKLKDNLDAAVPEFERAARIDPTLPDPSYTLGVIHMQQGQFADAARELEKTVSLQPANGAAWSVLGNVYKESGEPEKAAAALRRAIALQPDQPSTHISLAAILAQSGDQAGAAAERRQAAELSRVAVSRQRASFALKSGQALLDQGRVKEAETQLRTAVAADSQNPAAHRALAEALSREGHAADAAVEREQAAALAGAAKPGVASEPVHPD